MGEMGRQGRQGRQGGDDVETRNFASRGDGGMGGDQIRNLKSPLGLWFLLFLIYMPLFAVGYWGMFTAMPNPPPISRSPLPPCLPCPPAPSTQG